VQISQKLSSIHENLNEEADTSSEYVTAIYPFAAPESGDLPFEAGATILVLSKEDDWWRGRVNGVEGIFPSAYVQSIDDEQPASVPAQPQVRGVRAYLPSRPFSAIDRGFDTHL